MGSLIGFVLMNNIAQLELLQYFLMYSIDLENTVQLSYKLFSPRFNGMMLISNLMYIILIAFQMTSVERVLMYSELPQEDPQKIKQIKPADTWPSTGCIRFEDVSLSYDEGTIYVLKSLSFTITDKEKVNNVVIYIKMSV